MWRNNRVKSGKGRDVWTVSCKGDAEGHRCVGLNNILYLMMHELHPTKPAEHSNPFLISKLLHLKAVMIITKACSLVFSKMNTTKPEDFKTNLEQFYVYKSLFYLWINNLMDMNTNTLLLEKYRKNLDVFECTLMVFSYPDFAQELKNTGNWYKKLRVYYNSNV